MSAHLTLRDKLRLTVNREWVTFQARELAKVLVAVLLILGWTLAGVLWCERATMQADIAYQTALADQHRSVAARAMDALNDCEYRFLTKECK